MSATEWARVFSEAEQIGIALMLLSGGEPLVRRDVLEEAARHPAILFPVFSNGTMIDAGYLRLFDKNRNLLPVISIEGDAVQTDRRRGQGIYAQTMQALAECKRRGILCGASITVTQENFDTVTANDYMDDL
ncbi:MAG: radical SAM protein, partial [Spirochaetaceae bacterium]|nr:radical SAM protein [Spirochaetaceae bacterium]